jgi:catechol 2,3-dioxygenase
LNHIAFSVDTREDLLRAADILRDYGHDTIEFGPGRHAPGGSFFLYLREPGSNRIELYTGETLILAPDWQPIHWSASDNPLAYWGGVVPQSMYTYATPSVEMPQAGHSPAAGPGPQTAE